MKSLIPDDWQQLYQTFKSATQGTIADSNVGSSARNPEPDLRAYSNLIQMRPSLQLSASWNLSAEAMVVLSQNAEWIGRLSQEHSKPPFPSGYCPRCVEIWFDEILFVRWLQGRITYLRSCPRTYQPPLMELYFDDQLALAMVLGDVVVNRATAMAQLDQALGRLVA
jgi:hypothetical protein